MSVIMLCGAKGTGKTTCLRAQVAIARDLGRPAGGIAAPAVFEDGRRIGYDLLDLQSGGRFPLARLAAGNDSGIVVGAYRLEPDAVAHGIAAIIGAIRQGLDLVVIDEIGPLELQGEGWAPALEIALAECGPRQELILTVRPSVVEQLPGRFPSPVWEGARRVSPPWPESLWA